MFKSLLKLMDKVRGSSAPVKASGQTFKLKIPSGALANKDRIGVLDIGTTNDPTDKYALTLTQDISGKFYLVWSDLSPTRVDWSTIIFSPTGSIQLNITNADAVDKTATNTVVARYAPNGDISNLELVELSASSISLLKRYTLTNGASFNFKGTGFAFNATTGVLTITTPIDEVISYGAGNIVVYTKETKDKVVSFTIVPAYGMMKFVLADILLTAWVSADTKTLECLVQGVE